MITDNETPVSMATPVTGLAAAEANNTGHEPSEISIDVQKRYMQERTKRLRKDGVSQYIDLQKSDKYKELLDDPWVEAEDLSQTALIHDGFNCKYLILGAGYGGLYHAVRLIQAGIEPDEIRIVDQAGGFGGTWYWNRYPGLMCDVEAYIYMPLLEETGYVPKHRYSSGEELRGQANRIADQWELRRRTTFKVVAKSMTWDDQEKQWIVTMGFTDSPDQSIQIRSQFVIQLPGTLSKPQLAGVPGIDSFRGPKFHTSRWDYNVTGGSPSNPFLSGLQGKRVGIIGTGATSVQVVPAVAQFAQELFVFQRTPSSVDARNQKATTEADWAQVATGDGWQDKRRRNYALNISGGAPGLNLVNDGSANMTNGATLVGGPVASVLTLENTPAYVDFIHRADVVRASRIRSRVESIVKDQTTAELLKHWYPTWCKRPCFHDEFIEAFNLPNVHLVDTDGRGVDEICASGVRANGKDHELDVLIFSTGFRTPFGASIFERGNLSVTGRHGKTIDDKWSRSGVTTLHGVVTRDFPNYFFPGPSQVCASFNVTHALDEVAKHVAYIISQTCKRARGRKLEVEPTAAAEEEWADRVAAKAHIFSGLLACTPGYINRESERDKLLTLPPEEQKKAARASVWPGGIVDYAEVLERWRRDGQLQGLVIQYSGDEQQGDHECDT